MTEVPTVCLAHMSEEQKRAYVIADNRLAEKAGWDKEILAIEFETLFELAPELDLTVTGFEIAEIDLIIGDKAVAGEPDVLDEFSPPASEAPVVTRPWRPVAARRAPRPVRRCNPRRVLCLSAAGRAGADGVRGPSL